MTQPKAQKQKIVILGGGAASLTTAFELTSQPGWQDRYDITVYQMGWRLGGKGASGRNLDQAYHYRIEEHGVHIWFGLYDNAFRVVQRCYKELNRAPDAPLGTWDAAFRPHSLTVLQEKVNGQWQSWPIVMPTNDQVPGDDTLLLPLPDYLVMAVKFMHENFSKSYRGQSPQPESPLQKGLDELIDELAQAFQGDPLDHGQRLLSSALELSQSIKDRPADAAQLLHKHRDSLAGWFENDLESVSHWIEDHLADAARAVIVYLLGLFMDLFWQLVKDNLDTNANERHLWLLLNFAYGNICGIIKDKVLERGFDSLNNQEYREWLGQYLFDDGGRSLHSPLLGALYDGVFAYHQGALESPNLAAGIALRTYIRLYLTYKGAIMWKMQAGMGDVVFAPLYEVLQRRGVKFEFFHRVKKLVLAADKKSIARIELGQQATVKNGGYQPLFNVKGLPCWPSTPFYDQLNEGAELQKQNVNLESFFSTWPDVNGVQLHAGTDFDQVVLGISIGAIPNIAGDLIEANTDWQNMVKYVTTVRTQAVQLWLKPTAYELGWTMMGQPVLTSYDVTPLDTWADMSHLIDHENWNSQVFPLNIAYFCGPLKDGLATEFPFPRPEAYAPFAKHEALDLLNNHIAPLWPKFVLATTGRPNWDLLIDDRPGVHLGQERFESQYWRANVDPSERYVMSETGSIQYRLKPGQSGFANLVITGDWTDNGFNVGCVEATVMSGMLASNAICGQPRLDEITGLNF